MTQKKYKITFAPLQGYTDFIYRKIHADFFKGIDTYYTPFLRLPHRNKDKKDVSPLHNDMNIMVPQIIGGDVEEMKQLMEYVQSLGYQRVDINLGCPFPLIARKGKGSGALKDKERMRAILDLKTKMKVSLKLRLGWENTHELLQIMPLINDYSFHSVAVHARLGIQGYKGKTHQNAFQKIYEQCKHPLFYNGDLTTSQEITSIIERFPQLEGVMIGRGLLADPGLADRWKSGEKESIALSFSSTYEAFHRALVEEYGDYLEGGEHQLLQKVKTIWDYFLPNTDKRMLKKIKKCKNMQQYQGVLRELTVL
jgi:tRNA-dihydrouridine synthase